MTIRGTVDQNASYTQLVKMAKIIRWRRPEGLAYPRYCEIWTTYTAKLTTEKFLSKLIKHCQRESTSFLYKLDDSL